jgi:hypothetical protein
MRYYQCRLRHGNSEIVGWIEERGAKVGAYIEMIDFGHELIRVDEVYGFGIHVDALREKQRLDRNCLPSIARQ